MIYDILEVFRKEYDEKGDKLILDNYMLKDGLYVKINDDTSLEYFIFENDKKIERKENCFKDLLGNINHNMYEWFKERDYYSGYLNSDKAFSDKKLHNINYLSLFVKLESFISSEPKKILKDDAIINQYKHLCNYKKFKKKQEKEILESFHVYLSNRKRRKHIIQTYRCINKNLNTIVEMAKEQEIKNYIKIFFDNSIEDYIRESEIYYSIKIFNKIDFSKKIINDIFGLPDSNMGLNDNKPFLKHKTKKLSTPYMIKKEDALLSKKFFDWLKFQDNREKYPLINTLFMHRDFRDKDLILDFDYIPIQLKELTPPIKVENHLKVKKIEDYELKELFHLESKIDELFYAKQLIFNYFNDDTKVSKFVTKELQNLLFVTKYSMINYFKKYDEKEFYQVVKKYGSSFILNSLRAGYDELKAKESLNLKLSLLKYKGEEIMKIDEMFLNIKNKLDSSEYTELNREEFFFLAGQLANYLLAQKEQHQKKQDLLEPYLRCNNSQKLKKELQFSFFQYKHALFFSNKRFNSAMALIQAYGEKERMSDNMDSFLVGYLADNLFFEKKEK
jgi:CRISPR-associated protein Csh1